MMKTLSEDRRREASAFGPRLLVGRVALTGSDAVVAADSSPGSGVRSTYRFARHYIEMVVVMFAGMFVLMAPSEALFGAFGTSWSRLPAEINVFAMALTMTVPMVAWMRFRGHSWRANTEMAASMLIPTFFVMVVLWAGAANGTLMVPEHAGMLACMLAAMLLRRDEYSCATHHGARLTL
jgi:hypothetical protein